LLARYAPLVPEDAREGVKAMVDGAMRQLEFDDLRDEAPEVDLLAWRALVDGTRSAGKTTP